MPSYPNAIKHPIFKTISKAATNLQLESYVIGGVKQDVDKNTLSGLSLWMN